MRFMDIKIIVLGNQWAASGHQRGTFVPFPFWGTRDTMGDTHTLRHKDCPVCKQANALAMRKKSMRNLGLVEAGAIWLSQKEWKRRKPRTLEAGRCYLHSLVEFFGDIPLRDLNPGSLLAYQTERSKTAGASYINHELNALSQMLKQAGLWDKLRPYYAPLKEPEWQKPKVFTAEQEQRIFDQAKEDPNLELAEIVFSITRFTGVSGSELRLARIRQVDLVNMDFEVTGDTTKNTIRPRHIPLNANTAELFLRALNRAAKRGAYMPYHFLFPLRVNRALWNPNKPASRSWLRCQTKKLRDSTGIEHLRPHIWRHQIATEMLEQGKPPEAVKAVLGWCSEKMFSTYCHVRREAKLDAMSAAGSSRIEAKSEVMEKLLDAEFHLRKDGQSARADEILATIRILQGAKKSPQSFPQAGKKIIQFPS